MADSEAQEYDWGGDGSDLHRPVRAHVEAALVPVAGEYPAPLDQLRCCLWASVVSPQERRLKAQEQA